MLLHAFTLHGTFPAPVSLVHRLLLRSVQQNRLRYTEEYTCLAPCREAEYSPGPLTVPPPPLPFHIYGRLLILIQVVR